LRVPQAAPANGRANSDTNTRRRPGVRPATEDRPLLADHDIVSLPSATVLASLRQEASSRPPAAKSLAVLADPVFQADDPRVSAIPGARSRAEPSNREPESGISPAAHRKDLMPVRFGRLHFSRSEAESIAALVPDRARMLALDFAADKSLASGATLGQYRIVHFATHSVADTEHPELSGVALSMVDKQGGPKDGYLRLFDIYNLNLSADLVVLSACQTALGREIKREGLMSITRGFMYAGAPRVVSSLWSIDDKA